MAGADGNFAEEEQEIIVQLAATFAEQGFYSIEDAKKSFDTSYRDYSELDYEQLIRDSIVAIKNNLTFDQRAIVMTTLQNIAEADGYIDSAERSFWQLLHTSWQE